MNEERMQDYVALIQQLLSCPEGQENQIILEHQELLDEGLSLRSKSEVGSQKSEVFFNNLMVKTFYF